MLKRGLTAELKDSNWIINIKYPVQLSDLNPIEGIWNIIKPRLQKKVYKTKKELKEAIEAEWAKITIQDIRKRIMEMPERCKRVVKSGGQPIRSAVW